MEITSLFLYIAVEGDTVASIAVKFRTTRDDILRHNPMLRFREPIAGQPLKISDNRESINNEISNKREMIPRPKTEFNLKNTLQKIAFYTKEAIQSKAFFYENIAPIKNALDDLYLSILSTYYKIKSPELLNIIRTKISNITDKLIDFVDVIREKSTDAIQKYKAGIKKIINELKVALKLYASKIDGTQAIELLERMLESWNLFTLKTVSKKFEEAEQIFGKIILTFEEISQLLDNTKDSALNLTKK